MELPDDILRLIKEYMQPITRPDWRQGCYFNRRIYIIPSATEDDIDIEIKFNHVIHTVFRIAYLNFMNFDDILIYNALMNNNI
jgi:hypothetical protein